jgi:hypothetical protein
MYRALISFSGLVSMRKGEVREISDNEVVKDLLSAGYIEEVKSEKTKTEKPEEVKPKAEKSTKKKTSAKRKTTKK